MTQQTIGNIGGKAATQPEPPPAAPPGNAAAQPEPPPAAVDAATQPEPPPAAQPVYSDGLIVPGTTIGGPVGTFYADFTLLNPERTRSCPLNGLVDTGSSYTMIPAAIMAELGVEPDQTKWFRLANGDVQDFPVGWARIALDGQEDNVQIVFGSGSRVLIGSMALETFALAVDAKNHRLIPADLFL